MIIKILRYSYDAIQIKGGKWIYWWKLFPNRTQFESIKAAKVKEITIDKFFS